MSLTYRRSRRVLDVGVAALLLLSAGCAGPGAESTETSVESEARAHELARRLLIVDTHVDVPYRLQEHWEDVGLATESGDFDYPRARQGGLDAPFMSIYVPARLQDEGGARELADRLIDQVEAIVGTHPDKFVRVDSVAELRAAFEAGMIALPLGMENGAPIEGSIDNLRHFHQRGIRYITLAHSRSNHLSDSSYDSDRRWNGLSPFGRQVVAEMNRLGMMVDVSHLSDDAFWQVLEATRAPVIASHSSCRHFTPGFERNLSDEMIRALADNGGVIQINFGSAFLDDDYRRNRERLWNELEALREEHDYADDAQELKSYREAYDKDHPVRRTTLARLVDHIDHVVALVGIDHVGLGSDFDGVGDSLPEGLRDVSQYPNLIGELLRRGYDEHDVEKICSGNLLRVWSEVERIAAELRAGA